MTTTPTPTRGAADLPAMVSKALREAHNLGQRYWQQADSEYISRHKKADDTRAKFLALVEETCAALSAGQATAAQLAAELAAELANADSVQEEAARYRWLRDGNDAKRGAAWHVAVNLYGCEWDAAIDAARKRGAAQ